MYGRWVAACAMLVLLCCAAFAQTPAPAPGWGYTDTYQIKPFPNLATADSVINLVNAGFYTPTAPYSINLGYMCANIYVFGGIGPVDPSGEQLQACCSCPISRNGTRSVRARQLVSNLLTPVTLTSTTIKIVWTTPPGGVNTPASCNAAALPGANTLAAAAPGGFATGGRAWGTNWHNVPPTPAFGTETDFAQVPLSANETGLLNTFCGFIVANGSGFGICPGCPTGGSQAPSRQ